MKDKFTNRTFSLKQEDVKILESFAKETGAGYSSAVRIIIREWAKQRNRRAVVQDEETAGIWEHERGDD